MQADIEARAFSLLARQAPVAGELRTLVATLRMVTELERIPGFRNVVIHEYVALDLDRVVDALGRLEPIERFVEIVRRIESTT